MTGEIAGIPFPLFHAAILALLPLNRPVTPLRTYPSTPSPPPALAAASAPLCLAAPMLHRGPATPRPPSPGQPPLELCPVPKKHPELACPSPSHAYAGFRPDTRHR